MSQKRACLESETSREPKQLRSIVFSVNGETTLLHKFVMENSPAKLCSNEITAVLRSMSEDLPVNSLNEEGLNPLHIAILKEDPLMVERLFACINNMDVNALTAKGKSPIQLAVESGHLEIVNILLNNGADMKTCIFCAAKLSNWEIFKEIFPRGDFVTDVDDLKRSLLHWAAWHGNLDVARQLLSLDFEIDVGDVTGSTALLLAADNKHWEVVEELLKRKASVTVAGGRGKRYALHYAAEHGNLYIVILILFRECKIDAKDEYGYTALHLAAENCHWVIVDELLSKNASVDVLCGWKRWNPLHCAARHGNLEMVRKILLHGCSIDEKDLDGRTALYLSAAYNHCDVFEELLTQTEDISNDEEQSLLHCAARCGSLTQVKASLRLGYEIDGMDKSCQTALLLAAENNHWDVVEELLSKNASINVANRFDKRYPLHYAALYGNLNIVQQILHRGCEINARDWDGATALLLAAMNNHWGVVEALISSNASVNVVDYSKKKFPLHYAAEHGSLDIISKILHHDCEIDARDSDGETALLLASKNNRWHVVEALLARSASVNVVGGKEKRYPLHYAALDGNIIIVRQILHRGCDVNVKDSTGDTALRMAVRKGHVEIEQLLTSHSSVPVKYDNETH